VRSCTRRPTHDCGREVQSAIETGQHAADNDQGATPETSRLPPGRQNGELDGFGRLVPEAIVIEALTIKV